MEKLKEHKSALYLSATVIIAILVLALLYVNLTAAQTQDEDTSASAVHTVDTDCIEGLETLDFLNDEQRTRFQQDLQSYIASLDMPDNTLVSITQKITQTSDGYDFYFTLGEDEDTYYLCSYSTSNSVPFIFCEAGEVDGLTNTPVIEDTTPEPDPKQEQPQSTEQTTNTNSTTPSPVPETNQTAQQNPVSVRSVQKIAQYIPYAAAEELPHIITNYLAGKGIKANGDAATVDLASFTTSDAITEFTCWLNDISGNKITLDCEYNHNQQRFGMRII